MLLTAEGKWIHKYKDIFLLGFWDVAGWVVFFFFIIPYRADGHRGMFLYIEIIKEVERKVFKGLR